MASKINFIDIVGYEFYLITFTLSLCCLPLIFPSYSLIVIALILVCYVVREVWHNFLTPNVDGIQGRGILITGCDSGIGFAFAQHLDDVGFVTFAGCLDDKGQGARKLRTTCSKRLHIVPLDVTSNSSVNNALVYVNKHLPKKGLWGVVNNAGANMLGEIELMSPAIYEKGLNLNLYGSIRVTKAFLPSIRHSKGRVVNITSVHARMSMPRWSNYEVAKHSMETVSDSLRMEMSKFGVRVSVIQPGNFGAATSIHSDAMVKRHTQNAEEMWESASPEVKKSYSKKYLLSWIPPALHTGWKTDVDALSSLTRAVEHALCSGRPRSRYMVDGIGSTISNFDPYTMLARVYPCLPTWMIDGLVVIMKKGQT